MTIENTVAKRHQMLADFTTLKTKIEARKPTMGNYVLRWFYEGSSLYVGRHDDGSFGATGFDRASMFGDRKAAEDFVKRTQIRNGHGHPEPVLAFNAKQGALVDLDGVIATLKAMEA